MISALNYTATALFLGWLGLGLLGMPEAGIWLLFAATLAWVAWMAIGVAALVADAAAYFRFRVEGLRGD